MKKLVLGLLTVLHLHADAELDRLMQMSIEELLEVEITSATHTSEDMFTVPSSVTVFTYEQIRSMGVNSLEDLMNYVPGFQANRGDVYTNQKTAYVRGRYTNSGQKDILVLLDGQRLNGDWDGTALNYNRLIALENIQKVEFIRGPGSALYGSNAFLGVINIFSKKDLNNVGTRFKQNYIDAYANLSMQEKEYRLNAFVKGIYDKGESYGSQEDLYTQSNREPKDKNRGIEFYLNAEYKALSLSLRHQERNTREWYLLALNSDQSRSEMEHDFVRVGYAFDAFESFDSQLFLSYAQTQQDGTLAGAPFISTALIKEKESGLEWLNEYTLSSAQKINFGLQYRHPELSQADVVLAQNVTPTEPLAELNSRDVYGVYAQYQGAFSDVKVTLGARYDSYSDFGNTFNPRAALVYQALEDTSVKLLYGSAFRAPTYNELYYSPITGEVQGNPNLKPEEISTYEVSLVQGFANSLFNVNYFYNEINDAIEQVRNGSGLLSSENLGKQRYTGVEVELWSHFLEDDLQTRLGLTHITHSDQSLQVAPDTTLSAIVNYEYKHFNFNLSGFYHSSAQNDYVTYVKTLDAYTIVDTKIAYTIVEDMMAYLEIRNIFDEQYFTPAASPKATSGSPSTARPFDVENRGRLAYIGFEYRF